MPNPFRSSATTVFVCGEPQDEALARLDYLRCHGAGWCVVQGPAGIGKSMLLAELARRAKRRGDDCTRIELGPTTAANWLCLLADAWNIPPNAAAAPTEQRRRLQEHLVGMATMNRSQWLLVDQAEPVAPELIRGIRWLVSASAGCALSLIVVIAESDGVNPHMGADLRLELWPWETADCRRYVTECLRRAKAAATFSDEAIAALHERTNGVPGTLAKLCEWTWLAAQAESVVDLDADLVHAVANELLPSDRRPPSYEMSAAYGGW